MAFDAVGSGVAGPALTVPRIAPALKMFANSRAGVHYIGPKVYELIK
jgi:hypothetical protein